MQCGHFRRSNSMQRSLRLSLGLRDRRLYDAHKLFGLNADHCPNDRPCSVRRSPSSLSRSSSSSSSSSTSYRSSSSISSSRRHRRRRQRGGDAEPRLPCEQTESQVYQETSPQPRVPQCSGCHKAIVDPCCYTIRDQQWHESCAVCAVCSADLTEVCFFHNDQLLCRLDYDRLYAIRCANCKQPMRSHELFMRTRPPSHPANQRQPPSPTRTDATPWSVVFHVPCFTCIVCNSPLAAGDAYAIDPASGRPICRADYTRTAPHDQVSLPAQADGSACSEADRADSRRSTSEMARFAAVASVKRMRTSLTDDQRVFLQTAYEVNSRPSKIAREALAADMSVPMRVVQVWFQNQRARDKRAAVSAASRQPSVDSQRTPGEQVNGGAVFTPSPRTSEESVSGY